MRIHLRHESNAGSVHDETCSVRSITLIALCFKRSTKFYSEISGFSARCAQANVCIDGLLYSFSKLNSYLLFPNLSLNLKSSGIRRGKQYLKPRNKMSRVMWMFAASFGNNIQCYISLLGKYHANLDLLSGGLPNETKTFIHDPRKSPRSCGGPVRKMHRTKW